MVGVGPLNGASEAPGTPYRQQPRPDSPLPEGSRQCTRSPPRHVPLLPRRADVTAGRPLATPSSHIRQRVRRACLECRTKKLKCDGADPCSRCASCKAICQYTEFSSNHSRVAVAAEQSQIGRLEDRIESIEQMFRQILEQLQNSNENRPIPPEAFHGSGPRDQETSNQETFEDSVENELPEGYGHSIEDLNPDLHDNLHANKIQQLLDAAEADVAKSDAIRHEVTHNERCIQLSVGQPADHDHRYDSIEWPRDGEGDGRSRCYADGFGELKIDSHGQLRYVGLGSTASVAVENCIGLRRHITKGLERKGYHSEETFFTSPEATNLEDPVESAARSRAKIMLPPPELVDVLATIYVKELAYLFPITTEEDIRRTYQKLLTPDEWDSGHAAVFFAMLAVAAPLLPTGHVVFDMIHETWQSGHLGATFYNQAMAYVNMPFSGKTQRRRRSQDMVVALGLLSMYLAETSSQAEAWISIGRAIRAAQDIGLHRSPERLGLPKKEWNKRKFIWWCLFILERQLCTALGRPLSISDEDCDTEIPTFTDELQEQQFAGFTSMIHLHQIIGTILKIVNSVKNAESWRTDDHKKTELQSLVRDANEALQDWAKHKVPPHIKTATAKSGNYFAEKHIALSSFFSAVMLLHRAFIRNPHRPSLLVGSQAQLKSAKAATDCIMGAPEFFQCVPKSHFMVFHGQYVFVSALILLSCIRSSDNPKFAYSALRDVERAMEILGSLESSWKGALRCLATVEEYREFTFQVLQGDRQCHFDCDSGDQPHGAERFKASKRPLSQPATGERSLKKLRHSETFHPTQQPPEKQRGECCIHPPTQVAMGDNPTLAGTSPTTQLTTINQGAYFDNTIGNFLSAINPSVESYDYLIGNLGMQSDSSIPELLSLGRTERSLQNSFI